MKDHTMPNGKWEFDESVTEVFDDMLKRSIPQYETMRKACFDIAMKYAQRGSCILDIGCSRGEAIDALISKLGAANHFIGLEISPPMLEAAKIRFESVIKTGIVEIKSHDLRNGCPSVFASVILSIFTIQFIPIEYRLQLLRSIYDNLLPGGVFIFVEKILGNTAIIDTTLVDLYYNMKRENGYSQEEIDRKKFSLEGVLVPLTANFNVGLLEMAGFKDIDCFWRWMNFAGWLAIKS